MLRVTIDNHVHDLDAQGVQYPYEHRPAQGQHMLTGSQIKAVARVDPMYAIYLEAPPGDGEDRRVADGELLHLKGGERFYTVPPATM